MDVFDWAKSHPWETGGIVFVGGLALLFLLRTFSGGSSSGGGVDPNVQAYLNAEAVQNAAGDQLQAIQDQMTAATAQAGINAKANVDINNTWAAENIATTDSTNQASIKNNLISSLGAIGNNLGTTLTSSWNAAWGGGGSSSGIFGIDGHSDSYSGSKGASSQSFVANSEQGQAVGLLGAIEQSQFHAGS